VKKSSLEHILFKCILFVFIMQTISDLNRYFLLCRFELYASFMADSELMLFGERLLLVRKKRKVSQDDLAKKLGVHAPVIGRYERGEVKPSIETAARMAEALGVSLDYLTGLSDQEMNQEVMKQINELQSLKDEDQQHILKTMGALIREAKTRLTFG
jgi:transcriptional regulator with XRE-family HTH domain